MSKSANSSSRTTKSSRPRTPASRNKALARLRASKKALQASLQTLKKKHDTYQRAVYDWAESELAKEDLENLAACKEGLPLEDFILDLEKEIEKP